MPILSDFILFSIIGCVFGSECSVIMFRWVKKVINKLSISIDWLSTDYLKMGEFFLQHINKLSISIDWLSTDYLKMGEFFCSISSIHISVEQTDNEV